jgi:hypothetical protein
MRVGDEANVSEVDLSLLAHRRIIDANGRHSLAPAGLLMRSVGRGELGRQGNQSRDVAGAILVGPEVLRVESHREALHGRDALANVHRRRDHRTSCGVGASANRRLSARFRTV